MAEPERLMWHEDGFWFNPLSCKMEVVAATNGHGKTIRTYYTMSVWQHRVTQHDGFLFNFKQKTFVEW